MFIVRTLVIALVLSFASLTAVAGFKNVPFNSGVAFAPTEAVVGPISTAGGGVILRAIADCGLSPKSQCEKLLVTVIPGKTRSTLEVVTNGCTGRYVAANWILRSAAELVGSETNTIYRNVNLLGDPRPKELQELTKRRISPEDVFFVEVSAPLANTKAGEVLVTVDVLLTDPDHYASNAAAWPKISSALAKHDVGNWTWTDEHAGFAFGADCAKKLIYMKGRPSFTFLNDQKSAMPIRLEDDIRSLNPRLFNEATEFSRIAALFRYLQARHTEVWGSVRASATGLQGVRGSTPRMIYR